MCTLLTILLLTVGGPLSGMPADREQSGSDPTVNRTPPPTPQVIRRIVLVPPTEPSTGQSATTPVQPRAAARVSGVRPAAVAAASAAYTPADRAATPSPAATPVIAIREIAAVSPIAAATTAPTQFAVTVARATLSGVVTDQQGGRLVGATVTLGRTGGGIRTVPTNAAGEFAMSDLIPGDYELGVTLAGFKSYRAPVVAVTSPGVALRVQLQLGGVAESITVSPARAPGPAAVRPSAEALTRYFEALAALREAAQDLRPPVTPEIVPPASVAVPSGTAPRPVRIGGAVAPPQKIRDVRPIYPAELLGTGTQGVVVIEATIGTDGTVQQARILRSASAFDQAALTAVNQWVYSPGRLNGVPVDVTMTVSVRFEQ